MIGDPTAEQLELYDLLLRVQALGLATVAAGVPARTVDAACRSMIGRR